MMQPEHPPHCKKSFHTLFRILHTMEVEKAVEETENVLLLHGFSLETPIGLLSFIIF